MRQAFTLIELIFVIVIIGLLASVAVPKFVNLKQSAEANSVVKTTVDTAQQAANVAVNLRDLENNSSFNLKDLVSLHGKDWNWTSDNNQTFYNTSDGNVSVIKLLSTSKIEYTINCNNFTDQTTVKKCVTLLNNGNDGNVTDVNITF